MRIDKFLKVSRLIKRRTIAKEITENARIIINGRVVKPSYQVKIGDMVDIVLGNKTITIKISSIAETTKKKESVEMYEFISEVRNEELGSNNWAFFYEDNNLLSVEK